MNKGGFTLIEILLVVVLISVITAFSVPIFGSLVGATELNDAVDKVAHTLRRAQLLSEGSKEDVSWGVYVDLDKVVVFGGASYISRNTALDEEYYFSEQVNRSGDFEYVFDKLTGLPDSAGVVTLFNNFGSEDISVSEVGLIEY